MSLVTLSPATMSYFAIHTALADLGHSIQSLDSEAAHASSQDPCTLHDWRQVVRYIDKFVEHRKTLLSACAQIKVYDPESVRVDGAIAGGYSAVTGSFLWGLELGDTDVTSLYTPLLAEYCSGRMGTGHPTADLKNLRADVETVTSKGKREYFGTILVAIRTLQDGSWFQVTQKWEQARSVTLDEISRFSTESLFTAIVLTAVKVAGKKHFTSA